MQDTLSNLTTSSHTGAELSDILLQIGGGRAAGSTVSGASGDRRVTDVAAKEGGAVSVAPVPVSSVAEIGPTTFAVCAAQGEADGARMWGVYTSLDGATEENGDKLLA